MYNLKAVERIWFERYLFNDNFCPATVQVNGEKKKKKANQKLNKPNKTKKQGYSKKNDSGVNPC